MLKLQYLNRWLQRLCGKTAPPSPQGTNLSPIAWRIRTTEELRSLSGDFFLLIFGKNGVENVLEDDFPQTMAAESLYWAIPKKEITLKIPFDVRDSACHVEAILELEPDASLDWIVKSRDSFEERELIELAAKELAVLLRTMEWSQDSFEDEFENEQLRAKLSVRLMEKGIRCNGLASFSMRQRDVTEELHDEPVEESDFVQEEKAFEEIQSCVMQDWDELQRQFMESDLKITPDELQQLDSIHEDHLQNRFSLEQTTRKIMQMANEKAEMVDAPVPEQDYWSNEVTRRRIVDRQIHFEEDLSVCDNDDVCLENTSFCREEPVEVIDPIQADRQFRQVLDLSLKTSRTLYAQRRQSLELIIHLAEVRRLDREIHTVEDMLKTLPALKPSEESLCYRNDEIRVMLEAMEQGKCFAQQLEHLARELQEVASGSQDWKDTINESRRVICQLSQAVKARRRVCA